MRIGGVAVTAGKRYRACCGYRDVAGRIATAVIGWAAVADLRIAGFISTQEGYVAPRLNNDVAADVARKIESAIADQRVTRVRIRSRIAFQCYVADRIDRDIAAGRRRKTDAPVSDLRVV